MRHARQDYDRIQDPAGLIPDEEPVFLIRGQDVAAPAALASYAVHANRAGASEALVRSAQGWADEMRRWQAEHGGKVPDLPTDGAETTEATAGDDASDAPAGGDETHTDGESVADGEPEVS